MDGEYEYIDTAYMVRKVWNSNDIPEDAVEIVMFRPERHDDEYAVQAEWNRIKSMVYGTEVGGTIEENFEEFLEEFEDDFDDS